MDVIDKLGKDTGRAAFGPPGLGFGCPVLPKHPPSHTWTGSSTLLLRKLRELARFILRGKECPDLPRVNGAGGGGRECGKGSGWGWKGRLMGGEPNWWVVKLERDEGVHLDQDLIWGWWVIGWVLERLALGGQRQWGLGGADQVQRLTWD